MPNSLAMFLIGMAVGMLVALLAYNFGGGRIRINIFSKGVFYDKDKS